MGISLMTLLNCAPLALKKIVEHAQMITAPLANLECYHHKENAVLKANTIIMTIANFAILFVLNAFQNLTIIVYNAHKHMALYQLMILIVDALNTTFMMKKVSPA